MARLLNTYLPPHLLRDHQAGQVNILTRLLAALPDWHVAHHPETDSPPPDTHALTHMQEPASPRHLTLRRTYLYPFWRIEPTNERWNFAVAQQPFDPAQVDPAQARPFLRRLQKRLLDSAPPTREGFVFIPLQGRLHDHRSFQSMSPLKMIGATLAAEPKRPLIATLHPSETYSPADHAALAAISARHPRFAVTSGDARDLALRCDYLVTQNSSVALMAMVARKPVVLFAGIDFHHIAASVWRDGLANAFARVNAPAPDPARYLHWFFRQHSIDAQSDAAPARIAAILQAQGWPVTRP